jgi:hypothetical protein
VDGAQGRVAVADRVDEHPDADEVVDVLEAQLAGDHLLVDRVVVLRAPFHGRLDLGLAQVSGDVLDDVLEVDVAARRALGHQPRDLVEPLGKQRLEGEVFQLPFEGVHPEAVRERREDLQRLARLALLLVPRQITEGAHVVQPVGELDHEDPDVARHGDDHLAHGLGLGRLAVFDLVELGHPVDQRGDHVAEVAPELVERVGGVLDRVVQQRGAQRLGVHAEFGEDRGHRERMGDVRIAALALLLAVVVGRDVIGALDDTHVRLGMCVPERLDQRFEYRIHDGSTLGAEPGEPPADPGGRGRNRGRGSPIALVRC